MKKLFTILLLLPVFANAVTKYIDPAGSNGNTGAIGSPWLTLTYACTQVTTPGDIIHVNAGTYIETVQSVLAAGVSIEGVGITSIIKSHFAGSILQANILGNNADSSAMTIKLSSPAQGSNGNQHIWNIKMDGDALTGFGAIIVYQRSNVEISGCTFIDFHWEGVNFCGFPNNAGGGATPPTTWATGNSFHNNIVTNCSGTPNGMNSTCFSLEIDGQDGMLVYNNTMDQSSRAIGDNGFVINGVMGYNKNVKIHDNTITRPDQGNFTNSFDIVIQLWDCKGGVEIYNNTIIGRIDIGGYNTTKGSSAYSVWIHDNSIGQTTLQALDAYTGITLEANIAYITVSNNRIYNVSYGINLSIVNASTTANNINIYNNLFENIGTSIPSNSAGISWSSNHTNTIISNINIWNNTISGVPYTNYQMNLEGIGLPDIGTATNVSIRNNIITNFYHYPIRGNGGAGRSIDTLSIENNIFYNNTNSNVISYNALTPTHNTTQNNLTSNPLFISGSDFRLQSGSPAINAGINVGLPFVGSAPDIGAYEFSLSCLCFIHRGKIKYFL